MAAFRLAALLLPLSHNALADWGKPLWADVCTQNDTSSLPFCDMGLSPRARAADLVGRLSVDEKQLMIVDGAQGVGSLHLPGYRWWSEALHGVGESPGVDFFGSTPSATSFPQVILTAASFNRR